MWVTGPSAEANREGIQAIIDRAMKWERWSGAMFEGDKIVIISTPEIHLTIAKDSSPAPKHANR